MEYFLYRLLEKMFCNTIEMRVRIITNSVSNKSSSFTRYIKTLKASEIDICLYVSNLTVTLRCVTQSHWTEFNNFGDLMIISCG